MRFRFDTISFFIGMAAATLVWWLIMLSRPMLELWLETLKTWQKERAQRNTSGLEGAYRKALYKQSQGMHLAASLFSLDEIVEIPLLLAPPATFEPGGPHPHQDIVEETLPYLPNYPELGAFYEAPTLTLAQALSGGMNLAIIGQPGTGKTTALAYLAAQLTTFAPDVKTLHEFIPFLIHVADLGLPLNNPQKPEDFLVPINEKVVQFMSVFDAPRIPKFVEYTFASGRALLLLDGLDELPQTAIQEVSAYLRVILRQYPKTRVITTGAPEYLDGLTSIGFAPLAIMPWRSEQHTHFLNNWTTLWEKYVANEAWAQHTITPLDTVLLNRWLVADNFGLTPLEYTLKIWGAYAGDILSAHQVDTIEAHIRRLTPTDVPAEALSVLGVQASLSETLIFDGRRAREWTKSFEPDVIEAPAVEALPAGVPGIESEPTETEAPETVAGTKKDPKKAASPAHQHASASMISRLIASGLLTSHSGNKLRFSHPIFMGYLAGKGLGAHPSNSATLLKQPAWAGQNICMRYIAAFGDVTEIVNYLLAKPDPILMRPKLTAARLLRDSRQPRDAAWRTAIMAALVQILQNDDSPIGLRGEAMVALALNGGTNASTLFRQLLLAPSNEIRQLAALGAGLTRDPKAVEALMKMVSNSLESTRKAACLALVEIGTPQALEAVAVYLLRGDEQLRVYSAEALANHPTDGREALREGINSEDILVRRAIVFGLSRVNESWSTALLEKTQVDDEQWAVRNVAVELLQARQGLNPRIPKKLTAPHETPWLIEFAGKHGMGIIPGQSATDIMLLALKDTNQDFFQPALGYLRNSPNEGVLAALYQHLYGTDSETREAVFQTLAYIALGGTILPEPQKFGLG
jgi:hypothetical protein